MKITDLFNPNELTEKADGNFKVSCPNCGLQGGRTEGFIIFPDTNTWYCHSSGKHGGILELVAILGNFIKCVDCSDKDNLLKDEYLNNISEEYIEYFKNTFPDFFDYFLHSNEYGKLKILEMLHFVYKEKSGKKVIDKVNNDFVADYIINKYNIRTVFGIKEESIYLYNEGIWNQTGKGKITADIESLLGWLAKNNVVKEILDKIKRKTEISREDFDIIPDFKFPVKNGVLDLEDVDNIKFLEHNKKFNFKKKINIEYNPKAVFLKIPKFISETFYECDIPQVQEWGGLHLIRRYLFKKAVICQGPQNTGKSVFLNLLTKFLGEGNIARLSLQKISQGKSFDLLVLKDAFANIHDDLSSKDLSDNGGFKMAVGDGYIAGEQKFGDYFSFKNTAKQTYACNVIPPIKNIDDEAYYDRWLIWNMENVIPQEKRNSKLIDELTSPEELSGLLNWFVKGYVRLVKQNSFSNEKTCDEIKELMMNNSNVLARFVSKCLDCTPGSKLTKDQLYDGYCKFCINQKPAISPDSKIKIGNCLIRFAPFIRDGKSGSKRYWLNVKFRDDWDILTKNMSKYFVKGKESINIKDMFFQNSSHSPQKNNTKLPDLSSIKTKTYKKTESRKNCKAKSDREIQFYDANECKNITAKCTKEQVLAWIKENPNYNSKELYSKLGDGSLKFRNQLKKEGLI